MVGRSHGVLRHSKDVDCDRFHETGDKLDCSGMRCKELDYIDWNVTQYDSKRLEPETLVTKVNMLNTVNSCTRSEALPVNQNEATQNDSSPPGNRPGLNIAPAHDGAGFDKC